MNNERYAATFVFLLFKITLRLSITFSDFTKCRCVAMNRWFGCINRYCIYPMG